VTSLLRHIRACNTFDPGRFLPLTIGGVRIGTVRRDNAALLQQRFPQLFRVDDAGVNLLATGTADEISAALDGVVEALAKEGRTVKWRNEVFTASARWGDPPLFAIDRGAVGFFGVRAYGVHLNGYWRESDRLKLWIGRRALDKLVAPGKLDNLVAGGIGGGLGAWETLEKEAEEEASIPAEMIRSAHAAGAVSYRMEVRQGLRDDVLFIYDLETPREFHPVNHDGELVEFFPMDAQEALERVRDTDDFKFNVNLVIIDFALRHGLLTAADGDYLALMAGLRMGGT
jgi:8-oxo-dGTP pyrophosphatase MutT (NUDIX family)